MNVVKHSNIQATRKWKYYTQNMNSFANKFAHNFPLRGETI